MTFGLQIPSLLKDDAAKDTMRDKPKCICGKQECANLSAAFLKIGDIRGSVTRTPTDKSETKKGRLKRIRIHIASEKNVSEITSFDSRCSKKIQPSQTRSSSNQPKTKSRFMAWHHFHPALIKEVALKKAKKPNEKDRYVPKDTVPRETVEKALGRDSTDYTDADFCNKKKTDYYFLPNYPLAKAKGDLSQLQYESNLASKVDGIILRSNTPRGASASNKRRSQAHGKENTMQSKRAKVTVTELLATNAKQEENIRDLEDVVRLQHSELQRMHQQLEESKAEAAELKLAMEMAKDEKYQGVSRLSIACDDYHKRFPSACREFFRFDTWEYLKAFIEEMFSVKYEKPVANTNLSQFEQCLMALFFMENGVNLQFIAQIYGYRDHSQVSRILNAWIPEWGDLGEDLSILPFITAELIDELEPQAYVDLDLRKVGAIIDGKDFYVETVRKDRVVSLAQQGNKLKKSSFRILTWSLPCGLNFEHTDAFLARVSEKQLNLLWCSNGRLRNIPLGYLIMGDKGFDQTTGFYYNNNGVLHPAFLHGNIQFSQEQIGYNLRACQLRYTCETVYSNVTNCKQLYGFIRRNMFHHFQDICHWGHGRANLYRPLQMPAKHESYFQHSKRHQQNKKRKQTRSNNI